MGKSEIFLNGEKVGERFGGYHPIHIEVTGKLKPKGNVLRVTCDNSDDPDYPPGKPQGQLDFAYFGGIYRDVWLIETGPVAVSAPGPQEGVYLTTKRLAEGKWQVTASVALDGEGGVRRVYEGKEVPETFEVERPAEWTPDAPNLHFLRVEALAPDGSVSDAVNVRFAFREVAFDDRGLVLNGKPWRKVIGANRRQRDEQSAALSRRGETARGGFHAGAQRPLSARPRLHGRVRRGGALRHRQHTGMAILEQEVPFRPTGGRRHPRAGAPRPFAPLPRLLGANPQRNVVSRARGQKVGGDREGDRAARPEPLRLRQRRPRTTILRHHLQAPRGLHQRGALRRPRGQTPHLHPGMGRLRGRLGQPQLALARQSRLGRNPADRPSAPLPRHHRPCLSRHLPHHAPQPGPQALRRRALAQLRPRARLSPRHVLRRRDDLRAHPQDVILDVQGHVGQAWPQDPQRPPRSLRPRRPRPHALLAQGD